MALTPLVDKTVVENLVVTTVRKGLAPITKFSRNFSPVYTKTLQVKKVTGASAVQTNPTSYSAGAENTGAGVDISMDLLNIAWEVSPADNINSWQGSDFFEANLRTFCNALVKKILALATKANAKVVGTAANFTGTTLKKLTLDVADDEVGILLSPDYFVNIIPESKTALDIADGAYGFDLGIQKVQSSAFVTDVVGMSYARGAIGVAAAMPPLPENISGTSYQQIIVEGLGFPILLRSYPKVDSQSTVWSLSTMIGCAVLDDGLFKGYKAAAN